MVGQACDSPALTTRAPQLSAEALETPGSPSDLYLASSPAEVERARPFMTGDVFGGITIPGTTPHSEGLGIVLTHPATERGAERHTSVEAFHEWVRSSDASGTSRSAHGLLRSLTDKPDVLSDSRPRRNRCRQRRGSAALFREQDPVRLGACRLERDQQLFAASRRGRPVFVVA